MPHYSSDTGRLLQDTPDGRRYAAEQINLLWQHLGQVDATLAAEPAERKALFETLLTRSLPSQALRTIRTLVSTRVALLADTHALRPSPTTANQLFWETDRQHLFYTAASGSGFVWTVMPLGEMRGTLSPDGFLPRLSLDRDRLARYR
jgi:hypothetical protein